MEALRKGPQRLCLTGTQPCFGIVNVACPAPVSKAMSKSLEEAG